jgi:pimeloyl-ACP methyl ester carboxylesterase
VSYAIDLRGYGETPRYANGWLTPTQSVEDVEATLKFASARHSDLPAPILLGWSRGSKIAALTATRGNQPLSALILYAFIFNPNAPPLNGPASGQPLAVANTAEAAKWDFISPEVADPALALDFVAAALAADPTRVEVCCDVEFLGIHPEAIRVPTLLIQGARDPGIDAEAAAAFFSHLGSQERRWIIIGRGDHAAHLEDTATNVSTAMVEFITTAVAATHR